jgi:hypothetical protein
MIPFRLVCDCDLTTTVGLDHQMVSLPKLKPGHCDPEERSARRRC